MPKSKPRRRKRCDTRRIFKRAGEASAGIQTPLWSGFDLRWSLNDPDQLDFDPPPGQQFFTSDPGNDQRVLSAPIRVGCRGATVHFR
jgi:hypothetical protein